MMDLFHPIGISILQSDTKMSSLTCLKVCSLVKIRFPQFDSLTRNLGINFGGVVCSDDFGCIR